MVRFRSGLRAVFSVLMVVLGGLALQKAWAGVWLYRGRMMMVQGFFEKAEGFLGESEKRERTNPHLLDWKGRTMWEMGLRNRDPLSYEKAAETFEQLTRLLPHYGQAWLYLAMSRIQAGMASKGGPSRAIWYQNRPLIIKALQLEPGSAWVAYMAAEYFLIHERFLTASERNFALHQLRRAVQSRFTHPSFPYIETPSPLLDPALRFLWDRYGDFEMLALIVPSDFASYKAFLKFCDERELWAHRPSVYGTYSDLENQAYNIECDRGERLLAKGDFYRAFIAFRKAFWMKTWFHLRAKAGILAAQYAMRQLPGGKHELFQEDYEVTLKAVLEEEDELLDGIVRALEGVTARSQDPYLRGIQAFKTDRFRAARKWLEKASSKESFRNRYLAMTYWKLEEKEKAVEILRPALEEKDPDLRDLFLLEKWDPAGRETLRQKTAVTAIRRKSPDYWWGHGLNDVIMNRKGPMSMGVNLEPGAVTFRIAVRCHRSQSPYGGYVLVRLNGRDLGDAYIDHEEWKEVSFSAATTGGKRFLRVEFVNGGEDPHINPGPIIELGSVEIEYPFS